FVREKKLLDWPTALAKMTLLPARRLEARDPAMKHKGRVQPGADADITVFDPATVADQGKYGNPAVPSAGIRYVLVNGVPVVDGGKLVDGVMPGKPVRAPIEGASRAPVSER
ncbi:MAG TPA: amidohydrolase family protein, partial [Longimicrobiales bacterium]